MTQVEQEIAALEQWYAEIEGRFQVEAPGDGRLQHLCNAQQNLSRPIHSWYNLQEAYSTEFPVWLVEYLARTYGFHPSHVVDPFVGSGTTGLSLSLRGIPVVGVEYNPFIAWAAQVKSQWQSYDPEEITTLLPRLALTVPPGMRLAWPALTTLHETKYFRRVDVRALLYVLEQIASLDCSASAKQFLRLGVAAVAEEIANLRKDGRALRYLRKEVRPTARAALTTHWQRCIEDLRALHVKPLADQPGSFTVWRGSAVDLSSLCDPLDASTATGLRDSEFDLVLYSPPYLNNFDYSEVYKLELWLLGFLHTYDEWRDLRRGTIRSHHSVQFAKTAHLATDPTTAHIAERLAAMGASECLDGYAKDNMAPVITGYFDDMYLALREQFRVLQPGGMLVYMVANSRHSDLPIATDLLICEIARLVGFIPLKLIVIHKRNGRTRRKKYLRESVVILRKP